MSKLEMLGRLGVGGTSTVRLARRDDGDASALVAVKTLHPYLADEPDALAMLAREVSLGEALQHPNVVGVLGAVEGDPRSILLEYVAGADVATLFRSALRAGRSIPFDVASRIACDALAGLAAVHRLGVIHADVSPENVVVGIDGVARIADLGCASSASAQPTVISGKLPYLAPERLAGVVDVRSDLFALGLVFWELLTGRLARTSTGAQLLVDVLYDVPEPPSRHQPGAAPLDAAVRRALARSMDDRHATAEEMRAAIAGAVPPAAAAKVARVVRALISASRAPSSSSCCCRAACRDHPC